MIKNQKMKHIRMILDRQSVRGILAIAFVLLLVTVGNALVSRQWAPDEGKISGHMEGTANYALNLQQETRVLPISSGAYISVWAEGHYATDGRGSFMAQKYDSDGDPVWADPVEVANLSLDDQFAEMPSFFLVEDLSDGVFVVWQDKDYSSPDRSIYAKHLNTDGTFDSNFNGTPGKQLIYSHTYTNLMGVISDGAGGLVYSYRYYYLSSDRLRVQRVGSTGSNMWNGGTTNPGNGSSAIYNTYSPRDTGHDSGQLLLRNMTRLEGANNNKIMVAASRQISSRRYAPGVQRLDLTTGATELTVGGVTLGDNYADYWEVKKTQIVSDGAGGAYVAWKVQGNLDYMRIDGNASMTTYCADNGDGTYYKRVDDGIGFNQDYSYHAILSDGNGGAFFGYRSGDLFSPQDVKIAYTTTCSNYPTSLAVNVNQGTTGNIQLASDGGTGVYISWHFFNDDVYVQHVKNTLGVLTTTFNVALNEDYPIGTISEDFTTYPQSLVINNSGGINGAVIAWSEDMGLSVDEYDNYIHRVDNPSLTTDDDESSPWSGALLPQPTQPVNYDSEMKQILQLVDGSYVVAWVSRDSNNVELHAEKYNAVGAAQWNAGNPGEGLVFYSGTNYRFEGMRFTFNLLPSGNDLIVAFATYQMDETSDLYIQKIDSTDGSALWNSGTAINVTNDVEFEQFLPNMLTDGSDGAFLIWHQRCAGEYAGGLLCPAQTNDVYATHVTSSGTVDTNWNTTGSGAFRPVHIDYVAANAIQTGCHTPIITNGSGGFFVTYEAYIGSEEICPLGMESGIEPYLLYSAEFTSNGSVVSRNDEVANTFGYHLFGHDTISDGVGGFITTYETVDRSGWPYIHDLYAKRVGAVNWSGLVSGNSDQYYIPMMVTNGDNGAIIMHNYIESGVGDSVEVYSSYIDGATGTVDTTQVSEYVADYNNGLNIEENNYSNKSAVADGSGGAYVTYIQVSGRDAYGHVFVQHMDDTNTSTLSPAETVVETYTEPADLYPIILPGSAMVTWSRQILGETKFDIVSQYLDIDDAPFLSDVDPDLGSIDGGTLINVSGNNFIDGGTDLTIDGVDCIGITVLSAQSLTCTTPAHEAGEVDVTVTTANGNYTLTGGYTYVDFPNAWAVDYTVADYPNADAPWQDFPWSIRTSDNQYIVAWQGDDSVSGDMKLFIKKINSADGTTFAGLWDDNGIQVTDLTGEVPFNDWGYEIISDNNGGAYIAWSYWFDGHIETWAQHVSSDGTLMWGSTGVELDDDPTFPYDMRIIADIDTGPNSTDGLFITWLDLDDTWQEQGLKVTRLTYSSGAPAFTPVNLEVSPGNARLLVDSNNTASVVFTVDGDETLIKTKRITSVGAVTDAATLEATVTDFVVNSYSPYNFQIASDGLDGLVIGYVGDNSLSENTYFLARRILANGTLDSDWTDSIGTSGVLLSQNSSVSNINLVEDGSNGVFFVFNQDLGFFKIVPKVYTQYINEAGDYVWGSGNPILITDFDENLGDSLSARPPGAVSDGLGGFIFASEDSVYEGSVEVQRITNVGGNPTQMWPLDNPDTSGYRLFDYSPDGSTDVSLSSDGNGGAAVFWQGYLSGPRYYDIWGQYFGYEAPDPGECIPGPGQTCATQNIGCNGAGSIGISAVSPTATFESRTTSFFEDSTDAALSSPIYLEVTDNRGYDPEATDCGAASSISVQSDGLTSGATTLGVNLGTALTSGSLSCSSANCVPNDISVASVVGATGLISTGTDIMSLSEAYSGTIKLDMVTDDLQILRPAGPIDTGTYTGDITFTLY